MLEPLQKLLTSLQVLTWNKIFMLIIVLLLLLSTFIGYKYIDTFIFLEKISTTSPQSADLFVEQFSKDHIYSDANIHDMLVELRFRTEADWVLFLGIHNGNNVGPYHLKRISVIDEAVKRGNIAVYPILQNIPLTLFIINVEDEIIQGNIINEGSGFTLSEMLRFGASHEITIPIKIQDYEKPIGFISVFYKSEIDSTNKLEYIKETKRFIELELRSLQNYD